MDSAYYEIEVLPIPEIDLSDTLIHSGDSLLVTLEEELMVLWSTGNTTNPIWLSPDSSTIYTVAATNEVGCTSIDSFQILVSDL